MRQAPVTTHPAPSVTNAPNIPASAIGAAPVVRRSPHQRRYGPVRLIRANAYDLLRLAGDSYQSLAAFLVLAGLSTTYLLVVRPEGFGRICPAQGSAGDCFFPALYETFKLLIFQSTLSLPNDLWGRLLFFALPILGLGLIIQSVGAFGRQAFNKAGRLEAWQVSLASTFRNHVIVCGLGRIGWRVISQLTENGSKVVVIERNWESDFVKQALLLRVPVIHG
ncbi:MAG TPA: NAD-binding protein, partial [Ktedonobacterales bacterium]|nr:NAD-binding protein [Ktedonobacterales bacterium]